MRIRLRRGELAIIALTLMFACFIGGYFTGRRGAVNVVPVPSADVSARPGGAAEPTDAGSAAASNETQSGGASYDGGAIPDGSAGNAGSAGSSSAGDDVIPTEPPPGQTQDSPGALRGDDGRININTASRSELTDLSGIGNVLAGRIVDYREKNGPFQKTDDLKNVSGIGEKRFDAIKDRITVG